MGRRAFREGEGGQAPMSNDGVTIAEQIRKRIHEFTTTERKAAHVLLANYPLVGLEPVAEFAARSGVSAPTILSFVARLGIGGYPEFKRLMRDELEAQLTKPLMQGTFKAPPDEGRAERKQGVSENGWLR